MAISSYYFLVFIITYISFVQINGQNRCTPREVVNIVLYDDHLLSWNPAPDELCTISYYMVYIHDESDFDEHIFTTNQTVMDVGHLPYCTNVWFLIVPVSSDDLEGRTSRLYTKTPAPPDVNLNLTFMRVSTVPMGVLLEWDVADEWRTCIRQFRMVSYNEDDDDILTMYVLNPYAYLYNSYIIPCTSYVFTVTALYNLETEGHVTVMRYTASSTKISPPTLQNMNIGTTTVDLTWTLPGPTSNRCPVTAVIVDGSPYFNISYPIPSQNQIVRPPVSVRLTSLQPDTMYLLRVFVNNTAGFSDPAIVGVQTLESN